MIKMGKINVFIKLSLPLLLLFVLTLPLNLFLNNLFLLLFLIFFGTGKIISRSFFSRSFSKKNFYKFLIFSTPLILALFGAFYPESFPEALKSFERVVPVLFISYYLINDGNFFKKHINKIWLFFIIGIVLCAVISWGYVFVDILKNQKSFLLLFSQEYSNHNLTEFLDIHTPYVALFVNAALGFLVLSIHNKNIKIHKSYTYTAIIVLTIFLFNLMSRNAIFCFVLFSTIYLLKTKKYYFLGLLYCIFVIVVLLIFNTDKNYHRDRFINSINIFEKETIFSKKDDRFSRWSVSFDVFLKKPVFGPGPVKVKELRREEYVKNLDSVAYNFNYNAHNQLLEYLSTYGLLGAMLFIGLVFKLYQLAFNKKSYFLIYLVSCFVISGITESVLYRSWGISLYILILISIVGFSNQEMWEPKLKAND